MNEDLFDMFGNLKGLKVEDAKVILPATVDVRITEKDQPMTAEFKFDRLNLITNNGIVEDIFWG